MQLHGKGTLTPSARSSSQEAEDPAEVPEHPSLRRAAAPQGPLQPLSKFCSLGSAAAAGPRHSQCLQHVQLLEGEAETQESQAHPRGTP